MKKRVISAVAVILVLTISMLASLSVTGATDDTHTLHKNDDYIYTVCGNNTVYIDMYIGDDTQVIIPDEIEGYPVTGIGDRAFFGCTVERVVVGSNVESLGAEVFYNCQRLEEVTVPKNVKIISTGTFRYCTRLSRVNLAEGLPYLGQYMFYGCTKLQSIRIPESIKDIPYGAFAYCQNLGQVYGGNSVEVIGTKAFMYCSLSDFEYSERMQRIGSMAFAYNSNLNAEDAPIYCANIASDAYLGCLNGYIPEETLVSPPEMPPETPIETIVPETTSSGNTVPTEIMTQAPCVTEPCCTFPSPVTDPYDNTEVAATSNGFFEWEYVPSDYFEGADYMLSDYETKSSNIVLTSNEARKDYLLSIAWDVRLKGDANGDGKVNIKDATQIQKFVAGLVNEKAKDFVFKCADADANGKVNVRDATIVQKMVAGLE